MFLRSVAALSGGQMIAATITFLAAPILGRLYLPAEYGVLASYMSISSVLSAIGNWQYTQAIIVEGRDNKAEVLLRLCFVTTAITTTIAVAIAVVIVLYPRPPDGWQQAQIWFTAFVFGFGHTGLMVSYLLGQLTTFLAYGYLMFNRHLKIRRIGLSQLLAMSRKHKDYALFTTPSAFIGSLAMQTPIYALTLVGAVEMIGLFSRARQLLTMPITLLGSSIAQVFIQRAAVDYARQGTCTALYLKSFFSLLGIGIVPMILLTIWAPDIFEIFLGPDWRAAGNVARILAPMMFLRLICSPLSTLFYIANRQRTDFWISVGMLVLMIIFILVGLRASDFEWGISDEYMIIIAFSITYSLNYLIRSSYCFHLFKGKLN
jgi:O-antigen/teichoic acid export membrane protein